MLVQTYQKDAAPGIMQIPAPQDSSQPDETMDKVQLNQVYPSHSLGSDPNQPPEPVFGENNDLMKSGMMNQNNQEQQIQESAINEDQSVFIGSP